jgi:uncharacterized protein (TIGR03435 family)
MTTVVQSKSISALLALLPFLVVLIGAGSAASSQPPSAEPSPSAVAADYIPDLKFDVASIRENKAVGYETGSINPSHSSYFVAKNLSVEFLTQWGYSVRSWQVIGGPDWVRSAHFYIEAKGDNSADERLTTLPEKQARMEKIHMIRTLLEERFHLKTHWETREQPVYALVVAKRGHRLAPGGTNLVSPEEAKIFGSSSTDPLNQNWKLKGMEFYAHKCPMDLFARALSVQMGREVVDRTGLIGTYDFHIVYDPAQPDDRGDDPSRRPPMIFALEDQLGLKLESTRSPVRVLVIDQIERPEGN